MKKRLWTDTTHNITAWELVITARMKGSDYKLVIPAGTRVTLNLYDLNTFFVWAGWTDGKIHCSPDNSFSQPITVSKLVNGEWVEVAKFTSIDNGKPLE